MLLRQGNISNQKSVIQDVFREFLVQRDFSQKILTHGLTMPGFHRTPQLGVGEAALDGDDGRDGVDASFFGFAWAFSTGTIADWQGSMDFFWIFHGFPWIFSGFSMDFHGFPWISCKYSHLVGLSNILIHVFSQSHKTSNLCLAKCTYIVLNQP